MLKNCSVSLLLLCLFCAVAYSYQEHTQKFSFLRQKLLRHRQNVATLRREISARRTAVATLAVSSSAEDTVIPLADIWQYNMQEDNDDRTLAHSIKLLPQKKTTNENIRTFTKDSSSSSSAISSSWESGEEEMMNVDEPLAAPVEIQFLPESNEEFSQENRPEFVDESSESFEEESDTVKHAKLIEHFAGKNDISNSDSTLSEEEELPRSHHKKSSNRYSVPQPRNGNRPYLKHSCLKKTGKIYEHRSYPRSYEHDGFEASLPREWDWRNVSGVNYCSPNRNQHIPVYCGSCWVFGALGALNDRFNIARKNRWPMTMLSPQEIIACGGKGSCNGGEPGGVYEYAKTTGLVEEGCNNYKAVNEQCDAYSRCGSCWPKNCFAIANYTKYFVKDYGVVRGRLAMMAEIHNRGPIACSTGATEPFELNYTGGVYAEFSDLPNNHIVSVTGWGYDEESKTEYWIVRNSWGDAWGEKGWFRVVTSLYRNGRGDQYNMGIERECYFADPDVSNLD